MSDLIETIRTWEVTQKDRWDFLTGLKEEISKCKHCILHETRKNTVFGTGNTDADLMFVGEAPGADEDEQGKPFIGKAGQLLTKMIRAMGLIRDEVFIANTIKCRPPENRDPKPLEIQSCLSYLLAQINCINPRFVITLGNPATKTLLNTKTGITTLHGRVYRCFYSMVPVVPTFHPAYLLRDSRKKKDSWEDLKFVKSLLDNKEFKFSVVPERMKNEQKEKK